MSVVRRRSYRKVWFFAVVVFVAVGLFTFLTQSARVDDDGVFAANLGNFDAGYIISDYQMGNYTSMTEAEIQSFLDSQVSCDKGISYYNYLKATWPAFDWHFKDDHIVCMNEELFGDGETIGEGDTAAHIIWQAAQDYKINPQVLLVLLQKEQGLVTDSYPNTRQYRGATGYGCPDTAACSAKYYGFKNQVRNAASMFRTVLDGGWTNYPLGNNWIRYSAACSSGSYVNIRNLATSALYRYTPYQPNAAALAAGYGTVPGAKSETCAEYGNRNFYLYFEDWFGGITSSGKISEPRNLKASQDGENIVISWDEPSDANLYKDISYEIVIANSDGVEIRATVGGDKREYVFRNLDSGVYVAASVKAVAANSARHNRITFNFVIGSNPGSPTDLKAEKYNGGIRITWCAPSDDGGLKIEKYVVVLADVDKTELIVEVEGDKTEAVFYGLALKEYFASSVRAVNAKGSAYARITFSIKNYASLVASTEIYTGFSDMPKDEISRQAVSWAVYNGITDKNSSFNGEMSLTRRQAMVLLKRFYDNFIAK